MTSTTTLIAAAIAVLVVVALAVLALRQRASARRRPQALPPVSAANGTGFTCPFCVRPYDPARTGGRCPACGAAAPRR